MSEDKKVKDQDVKEAKEVKDQDVKEAKEVKAEAPKKETKSAKPAKGKAKKVKVRILCHNAAGKYKLPQHYGMKVTLDENQANEIVDNKDGEIVK